MKKIFIFLILLLSTTLTKAQSVTRLLAASPFDDVLRVLDTNSYAQITTKTLTTSIGTVNGITGLAKKPSTGVYYVIMNVSGTRYLGSLNPLTGGITSIGSLGDNFSQLTFNGYSTMLGITGTGANTPNTVYRINPLNANKTAIQTINGSYGQVICYNPNDNKVYHWTGGSPYTYKSWDTLFTTSTNITPAVNSSEVMGAVYKTNNSFVTYDWDQNFRKVHTTGASVILNNFTTQSMKGLAYITCSRTITASSASVCTNGQVTFTMSGTPGATYQWYKNNVLINGATNSTLSAISGGYFKCRINDGCGQDSLAPGKNIFILSTPSVAITGNTVACSGQTLQLVGSSGGTSQWYKNGVLISGATTNSYIVSTAGTYNMIKTNLNGCADSASIGKVVIVAPSPIINILTTNTVVCPSQSATLSASGANSFVWNTAATTSSIVVSPSTATIYSVTGTSTAGCIGTGTIFVLAGITPTISIASPTSICAGLSAIITASGANTYSWSTNANTATITVSPTSSTIYSVSGTNLLGCSATQSTSISVVNNPTLNISSTQSLICANETVTLTVNGANTYTWSSGATNSVVVITPSSSTSYTITGELNGCLNSKTYTQSVSPCTGISQIPASDLHVTIFPNPSAGVITIESSETIASFELYAITGQLVLTEYLSDTKKHTVNVSSLPDGVYFIKTTFQAGKNTQSKLIIQK